MTDAVVIGAGPNGLVAANLLADAGWDVLVLEAQDTPGGAVRSAEVTLPGYVSDLYSAFYPLGLSSPVMSRLGLDAHGLRWAHAPAVLGHPLPDGRAAMLYRDLDATAAGLDAWHPGDGDAWRGVHAGWERLREPLLDALFTPFPPVRAGARLAGRLGMDGALRFARFATLSVRRYAQENFTSPAPGLLLAGNAIHTDLAPESPASGIFGWLLAMLGQSVGFPVPAGGAGKLTEALVQRLQAAGGRLECSAPVDQVLVRDGRAAGVRTVDGREFPARRAVLADVDAPSLYLKLVGREHLPPRLVTDLERFQWDNATVKVDWALSAPIPWTAEPVRGAGTVHIGGKLDNLSRYAHALDLQLIPERPFVIVGQMTTSDPTRSPAGTESAWGYTHVPWRARGDAAGQLTGDWTVASERERFLDRLESQVEAFAPGFRDLIQARHIQFPHDMEAADGNLVGGAINGGTAGLHQQLVFRPVPGLARPETPIPGLYLASSSAHPGGGVHGGCGANAARAALHAKVGGQLALGLQRALIR
ncbi:MAG: NAD(P)/FAD-dependent oxidoreductase [Frankiaceae bacterium]